MKHYISLWNQNSKALKCLLRGFSQSSACLSPFQKLVVQNCYVNEQEFVLELTHCEMTAEKNHRGKFELGKYLSRKYVGMFKKSK